MTVAFGPEGLVFGPTAGVIPNRVVRPVIGGVSQASIAGIPAHHSAALAAPSCHGSGSTQSPQCMIISALQSVWCLCEQRGKDSRGNAWQRIEDRRVTLLGLLPRCGLPILVGNWLREFLAQAVKLSPGVGELTVDDPYPLDQTTDASGCGLNCSWSNWQSGLAQLAHDMGRIETTYAVALE